MSARQFAAIAAVLGFYAVTGFFVARWLFLQAQDTTRGGPALLLPVRQTRTVARGLLTPLFKKFRNPAVSLIVKELQLHRTTLWCAAILALLHTVVTIARKLSPHLDVKCIPANIPIGLRRDRSTGPFWWPWLATAPSLCGGRRVRLQESSVRLARPLPQSTFSTRTNAAKAQSFIRRGFALPWQARRSIRSPGMFF